MVLSIQEKKCVQKRNCIDSTLNEELISDRISEAEIIMYEKNGLRIKEFVGSMFGMPENIPEPVCRSQSHK